jgi:hypothetical protein
MTGQQNCNGCRFWSEMIAFVDQGVLKALCLSATSPERHKNTGEHHTCGAWKSNHLGAVDQPPDYGATVQAAYDAEEKQTP